MNRLLAFLNLGGSKYSGEDADGFYTTGKVRAKIWKMCQFARPAVVKTTTLSSESECG